MKHTKILLSISMLLTVILLAACSSSITDQTANLQQPEQSEPAAALVTESPEGSFQPQQIIDASGEQLEFQSKVEKVACVVSLCVDIAAELGMEPVAIGESGVRTIAVAEEFYGEHGTTIPSIGGSFFEPNLEDIITVKPDLVIGLLGVHDSLREGLAGAVPVYLAQPKTYSDSVKLLEDIGRLTGRTDEAKAAAESFLGKLEEAKQKAPKDKKALIMYGTDINFSIVTDSGLGGSVLKEVSHYPFKVNDPSEDPYGEGSIQYSLEKLLEENPDVIFVESYSYSPGTKALSEQMQELPLWSKLKAVQEQNVIEVRSPIWGDGRGTRSLGILLDEALEALYPDLF
ncbi:ABC transporter substrate-binding protein [Paenibacillus sp. FSL R7-0273]|uniref:ABC transporter substrate-binding protein n=1 Tax=Paenibacillus sp. FSL R7-0273 TaxID=1536772 RepID=UPI0004F70558|nr:ABC transporter substrate-binding protein [Paenibacillus sp. FSL R7-0273]AIQ45761.1 ABC transporter substrate-binding protein [Paenibacillus sp. FSL R7-0273]OMF95284.1 ABC transporter substrate-binding protein [Paenibacillus sp. FSL R7-0273]